jgi:hypothetical protein
MNGALGSYTPQCRRKMLENTEDISHHLWHTICKGSICIAMDGLDTYFLYGQEPVDIHSLYHDIHQQNLSLLDDFSIVDGIGIAQEDALISISCTLSTDL